ncbi:MAG: zinc metalloprotease HtpX [Candidatus Nanoarchaeia archaeon]|nr:zinc metalloprotease HtpX [Candidatus Nanoarchaeia archaeon]
MKLNVFNEVRNNKIRSFFIMSFFIVLIGIIGGALGVFYDNFYFGLIIAIIAAIIYTLIVFNSGDLMILKLSKAKEATKADYPYLFHTIEGLAIAANIPKPKAYVIEDESLNAFATGKDPKKASICVTTGLLKKLNRQELEGVIAHEMSHVKNYDIRVMMLTAVLVGITVLLSNFLIRSFMFGSGGNKDSKNNVGIVLLIVGFVLAILTPVFAELIKLAISRKREYMADASAAVLTRYPPGLASALEKIKDSTPMKNPNKATAHLFINSPFKKTKGFVSNLFSTHPPIEERIRRLRAM